MKEKICLIKVLIIIIAVLISQVSFSQKDRVTTIDFKASNQKETIQGNVYGYRPELVYVALTSEDARKDINMGVILNANTNKSNAGELFLQIGNPFQGARIETIDIIGEVYNGNIRLELEAYAGGKHFSKSYQGKYSFRINTAELTGGGFLQGNPYNLTIRPVVPVHLKGAFLLYPDQMHMRIIKINIIWGE